MFFFLAGGRKVEKLRLFFKAHDLKKLGFSIEKISRKLGISRNTVYKHLNMFYEEGVKWTTKNWNRAKILDPYEKHILSWLKEHPDLSSAQIEDWLKRHFPELKVGNSVVYGKLKM